MKILVAIAYYGTRNQRYLEELLDEYASMPWTIDVVILTEKPKTILHDVEVRVGLPTHNPWSLPFAHKELFVERAEDYDLFIYSEDDTLIKEKNIRSFLEATQVIPLPRIVGFMRYEEDTSGKRYCSTVHAYYHWILNSVERIGPYTLAQFSNDHAASFILTRQQLKSAIDSGGFLVPPHNQLYDFPCTAATDPYTQCGMKKVICISHIDDFLLHHLPNNYIGHFGISLDALYIQIHKLIELGDSGSSSLFCTDKSPRFKRFSKRYYEPPDEALLNIIPNGKRILSYGAGCGDLEIAALNKSKSVKAVPIDPVMGAVLQHRNIQVITMENLGTETIWDSGNSTDCILLPNVLQHVEDPVQVLRRIAKRSNHKPIIAGIVPNLNRIPKLLKKYQIKKLRFSKSKLHPTTYSVLRDWASRSDFDIHVVHVIHKNLKWLSRFFIGTIDTFLSERIVFVMYSRKHTPEKLLSEIDLTKTRTFTDIACDEKKLINFTNTKN